jgi:hypothetical protein
MARQGCGPRRHASIALGIALVMAAAAARADQEATQAEGEEHLLKVAVLGGASWSDNIARVGDEEEGGSIGRAGLLLDWKEKSRRLDADVDVDTLYEHFFDDTFEDDLVGGVDGKVTLGIVPDRFNWYFEENLGQITLDPFAAVTPANREDINYFTTGPDFLLHFGSDTSLQLSGRYSDTSFETSHYDGTQTGGFVALGHNLSTASRLSLNVEANQFEFDDQVTNTNYDRTGAFVRYEVHGARTELQVDAGYSAIDLDGGESFNGLLARINAKRRMSTASTLTFAAGTQFGDSGELFRQGQDLGGGASLQTSRAVIASSDPFESHFASLGYDFNRNRTSLGFSVQYNDEQYETNSAADRSFIYWSLYGVRQMSPVLSLRAFATLSHQELENADFDDDELRFGLSADWNLARTMSLRAQIERYDRNSSTGGGEYQEDVASLFVIWSPIDR